MGFGIFKKMKDAFKKTKYWLQKVLPGVRDKIKEFKPIIPEFIPEKRRDKVIDLLNIVDDGAEAVDELINKKNPNKSIDWIKHEIQPRLKKNSLI